MNFSIRVIQPANFLSTAAINFFHSEIKSILESEVAVVLVDLTKITSMSSPSFMAVVKALRSVRASNRQIFLCSMNEQVRILFELTGLDQVFKTFLDIDDFNRHMQTHGSLVELPRQTKHHSVQRESMKLAS